MSTELDHTTVYPPLLQALCNPDVYPHHTDAVRIIETHISWVLLTGPYAYKIKKPVAFSFLDFSTLEKRQFYCAEEVRLNRRLAAELYLAVVPITGSDDDPELAGAGQIIEYAVKMAQFPAGQLLAEQAACGQLEVGYCDQIADRLADFHGNIARAGIDMPYGDSGIISHWFVENFAQLGLMLKNDLELQQMRAIEAWGVTEWQRIVGLVQSRKQLGYVRECHGDLHLGNMTLIDGKVVLFDCIEFNPELRWIDVISDLAFLMVDLLHFAYDAHAYRVLNRYLQETGDYAGLGVLRYYLVYRALVRGKVALLRATGQRDTGLCQQAQDEYAIFARLAERFTDSRRPQLIITHGYSGSGKSTFAAQLAEKSAAIQLRSDVERKRLFGYRATGQTAGEVYTQTASRQTYQRLAELTTTVIQAGFSAIVDATFLQTEQRQQFKDLAVQCGVTFVILDFQAGEQVLMERINRRLTQQNDASEATVEILRQQLRSAQPLSADEQSYSVSIDAGSEHALTTLLEQIVCGPVGYFKGG
ncbi:MAG: AAA family ATPase [Methylovulum sp.]|nr:AAA family ATPase [Methylovulum sp.]